MSSAIGLKTNESQMCYIIPMKMNEKKQVKILLILPFFYPHRGGSQKYAEEIYVKMMENHPNVKVDVLAYNTDRVDGFENYRGFRIYRIPCWNVIPARFALPNPFALSKKLKELAKNEYDYVNTHIRFFDPTWWVWRYAKKIGAKSFYTGHVAIHPVHQNKVVEVISKIIDLTLAKASLNKYDLITFTNKTAEKFFKEKLGLKKETNIVYGGIDTEFFVPKEKKERVLPKLNIKISDDSTLITYVGRMIWTKGVTYFYTALKEFLSTEKKDVIFVLAGPGELEQELRNQIKEDGLEDKVIMTGDLKYEQVRDLLAISDIFINPSHHNEGFPNTVLEAGASGCYVIATDNAGSWEVVRNEKTGQLIPQKDSEAIVEALKWAIRNKDKRQKMAQSFREMLIKEFDWNIISEKLYKILLEKMF